MKICLASFVLFTFSILSLNAQKVEPLEIGVDLFDLGFARKPEISIEKYILNKDLSIMISMALEEYSFYSLSDVQDKIISIKMAPHFYLNSSFWNKKTSFYPLIKYYYGTAFDSVGPDIKKTPISNVLLGLGLAHKIRLGKRFGFQVSSDISRTVFYKKSVKGKYETEGSLKVGVNLFYRLNE